MTQKAIQDCYPEDFSYCYGCGRLNADGLQIKSYWDGTESVARYRPADCQIAFPGYVYGGLIASLIDCHCIGTAAAAVCREQGLLMDTDAAPRYVTGSLKVDYLAPTPMGMELEIRARPVEIKDKKVTVEAEVAADGRVCATGRVVAVRMPEGMLDR